MGRFEKPLSYREQQFAELFLSDPKLDRVAAAVKAGYSEAYARKRIHELLPPCELLVKVGLAENSEEKTKALDGLWPVQRYIYERMVERRAQAEIDQARVIRELAHLAFARLEDCATIETTHAIKRNGDEVTYIEASPKAFEEMSEAGRAAIAEISSTPSGFKLKMHDKTKPLELLMKHFGMLALTSSGEDGGGGDGAPRAPRTLEQVEEELQACYRRQATLEPAEVTAAPGPGRTVKMAPKSKTSRTGGSGKRSKG